MSGVEKGQTRLPPYPPALRLAKGGTTNPGSPES